VANDLTRDRIERATRIYKAPLFRVCSQLASEELQIDRLVRDQKQVDVQPAYDCHVLVENDNRRLYIRRGLNQNQGVPQHDCAGGTLDHGRARVESIVDLTTIESLVRSIMVL
jgi:hypothetical protein